MPLSEPHLRVVADGLFGPVGLEALPNGSILIAEEGTGQRDDSAGVSLLLPDGTMGRLISGLPSTRDSGDLAGVPLVKLSPDGATLYVGNFGAGHVWTLPLSAEEQAAGLALPDTPYVPDDLGKAMLRLNNVMVVNPFDMTFDADGVPVVSDATGNGVAKENPDGTTRFIHRFDRLPNPDKETDPIEAVPTGIVRMGEEYYVTLFGGCPYPDRSGLLVAIDEERNQRTVLDGLNMPIDVAEGPDGTMWVLEFATFTPGADCFSGVGYQVKTGRLSRLLPDGSLEPVLEGLNTPGSVLPMPDGSLYISEVFPGRVMHVTFGEESPEPSSGNLIPTPPATASPVGIPPDQYDAALADVVAHYGLQPNPGREIQEGDTERAQLGQLLFFDPILSGDKNISCATCHHPSFAMADGRVLPIGAGGEGLGPARRFMDEILLAEDASADRLIRVRADAQHPTAHNPFVGQFVPRNSPTVINSALLPLQFWDGRVDGYAGGVNTLERAVNDMQMDDPLVTQAMFPITSLHEMAGATFGGLAPQAIRRALAERLRGISEYVDRFSAVYGTDHTDPSGAVTVLNMVDALAAFERRLVFTDAAWDRYLAGEQDALSGAQKRGALLFFGETNPAVNCANCHSGDLFTDLAFHNLLAPQLGPGKGHGYSKREDYGRASVTFDARERYAFRTPSLRNVALTAPYFHSGAYATLDDAIRHHADMWEAAANYDPSANGIPPDLYSSLQPFDPQAHVRTAAPELAHGLPLSNEDVADLVAFLDSLTDPAAQDLSWLLPESVPSGLPLDPLPAQTVPTLTAHTSRSTTPAASVESQPEGEADLSAEHDGQDGILLRDVADAVGLDFVHGAFVTGLYEDPAAAMGGGLCWIDYDGDGWLDLYLVNSHAEDEVDYWQANGGLPRNVLYRNEGGLFRDVSAATNVDLAMRGTGCVAVDFNRDGHMDLYVSADGPDALLWNQGDGTFIEGAAAAGLGAPEWTASAAAGDLNNDGWPDLFVTGYIDLNNRIPKPVGAFPQDYYGLPDRLYINEGPADGAAGGPVTFREVTVAAGLTRQERGLGALLSDLDDDGDLDLYIANDGHPNRLYANEPWPGGKEADPEGLGFRFVDLTDTANVGDSGSGMGVASGDYDGDGWLDLFITNWERELNALYRNETAEQGHLTFQYSTFRIGISGLGNGKTGWGTHLIDIDHDTDADLLIANGRVPVTNLQTDPELVRLYLNRSWNLAGDKGRTGHFLDWTKQAGLEEVGPLLARGSAAADFDNDGDLDVAINTIAGRPALLRNEGAHGNWLQIVLEDPMPGTRVTVTLPDGRTLVREVHAGSSYLATEDPRPHFGLGTAETLPSVVVRWPGGSTTELSDVPANQRLFVSLPD
jgi:cytochrome c peroxidase